jgi:hypothetical protein
MKFNPCPGAHSSAVGRIDFLHENAGEKIGRVAARSTWKIGSSSTARQLQLGFVLKLRLVLNAVIAEVASH